MDKALERSREIRVFLSSTFKDMEAEREYLLGRIFPEIRKACAERGVSFSEIDLRWGVTEEDSKNGKTVEICLEEIDRSREYPPFFVGFLGERYGWVPKREDLEDYWKSRQDSPYRKRIEQALEEGISVTELEMVYGILERETERDHSLVLLRSPEFTAKLFEESGAKTPKKDYDDDGGGKLAALKDRLRKSGLVGRDGYRSLEEFGQAVKDFLLQGLEASFPETEKENLEEQSDQAHRLYARSRREGYVPLEAFRERVWERITRDGASAVLQVVGESGLGKSALVADLETWIPERSQGDSWVFAHYIGADGDRSLSGWRDRLFRRLVREGFLEAETIPAQETARWEFLPLALFQAQKVCGRRMILLLDAVDQVSLAEELNHLKPLQGLKEVHLILTGTPERPLGWGETLALTPLDVDQRKAAIETFLEKYRKKVDGALLKRLVKPPSCAVPLYLRLLLEELRLHASHENLNLVTEELLKEEESGGLFLKMLAGIDRDVREEGITDLGSRGARLMAASRRGLRRRDLAVLLDRDPSRSRLPDRLLSPVLARLEPFCLNDNGRLYIMHALLRSRLLEGEGSARIRKELIDYSFEDEKESLAERLYQYNALKDETGLREIMGDIDRVTILWEYDPKLLETVLIDWDAGKDKVSPLLGDVSQRWKGDLTHRTEALPEKIDELSNWFFERSFRGILEPLLEGILEWRRRFLWSKDQSIGETLSLLSSLYLSQWHLEKAEPLMKEALEISRSMPSMNYQHIVSALINLASLYEKQDRLGDAEACLKEALEICDQFLPEDKIGIATIYNNLGEIYRNKLGGENVAESFMIKALELRKMLLPRNHSDITMSLNNLGTLYLNLNNFKKAEDYLKIVLDNQMNSLPPDHPHIAISFDNLGSLYKKMELFDKAESYYKRALKIYESSCSENNPEIGTSYYKLGELYWKKKDLQKAEECSLKALEILRSSLSVEHSKIGTVCNNLALIYKDLNLLDESEKYFREALKIYESSLGKYHHYTQGCLLNMRNLMGLYKDSGETKKAETLLVEYFTDSPLYQQTDSNSNEIHELQEGNDSSISTLRDKISSFSMKNNINGGDSMEFSLDSVKDCIVHLYTRKGGILMNPGYGIIVSINGINALLTAAHIVEDRESVELWTGIHPEVAKGLNVKTLATKLIEFRTENLEPNFEEDILVIPLFKYAGPSFSYLNPDVSYLSHAIIACVDYDLSENDGMLLKVFDGQAGLIEKINQSYIRLSCSGKSGMSGAPVLVENKNKEFHLLGIYVGTCPTTPVTTTNTKDHAKVIKTSRILERLDYTVNS